MSTKTYFSVCIYSNKKKVQTLNEVRENGNFRALRRYIDLRINSGKWAGPIIINVYFRGVFQRQIRYTYQSPYF